MDLKGKIFSKLMKWELALAEDELTFEDPAKNFLLQKMLRFDIEEYMIPSYLRYRFKKTVKVPNDKELQKAAYMVHTAADYYGWNFSQEIDSVNESLMIFNILLNSIISILVQPLYISS